MRMNFKPAAIAATAALGLTLAACDSEAEEQVEEQATAIDESYEAEANLEEALAAGGPNEEAVEQHADSLREEGEEIKDDLEDAADEMDTDPQ